MLIATGEASGAEKSRMKYAVWFLRLVFGAWMIPAGLMHFIPLFPQPLGSQPLSREVMAALLDSHLMDVIKAVELLAGLGVFIGFHAPLALLVCMPVSFCVYWWDAHLQRSGAAVYGIATLLANGLLCLAYLPSYREMLAARSIPVSIGPSARHRRRRARQHTNRCSCVPEAAPRAPTSFPHFSRGSRPRCSTAFWSGSAPGCGAWWR